MIRFVTSHLTPFNGVTAEVSATDQLLVALNWRDPAAHDV